MKKIVLLGGLGTIGRMLKEGLENTFDITVMDTGLTVESDKLIRADVLNYEEFKKKLPKEIDVLVNLISVPVSDGLVDVQDMNKLVDTFFKTTYHIYCAAAELGIPKVVNASSNHVTDHYEARGASLLDREITVADYPYSNGLYGILKLASENTGFAFHNSHGMSVINLRIGSVRHNEKEEILKDEERFKRTWLSERDAVQLFHKAIEADVAYGTYYGVSENEGKPWSLENAKTELGYAPSINSADILGNK